MIYDPTFLWSRVASIAFASNYTYGTPYTSPYCVHGSTNQPTSLTGGLKNGTLGPQTPPFGAKSTLEGWLINGTTLTNSTDSSPARTHSVSSSAGPSSTATGTGTGTGTGSAASSSARGGAVRWSGSPNSACQYCASNWCTSGRLQCDMIKSLQSEVRSLCENWAATFRILTQS